MKIINDMNFPEPFIHALENDDYDGPGDGAISVTTLMDSPYRYYLKQNKSENLEIKASSKVRTFLGSAVHYMLEKAGSKYVTELRTSQEYNGLTISGKIDLFDPKEQILWDYKTAGVSSYIYEKDGKFEYHAQLNINKWLMEANGLQVSKLKLLVFFLDWKAEKTYERDYPQSPIIVVDIPVWDWAYLTKILKERTEIFKEMLSGKIFPCSDKDRWQKKPKYACQKPGTTRAFRVFDTQQEAQMFISSNPAYEVNFRPGAFTRCESYCELKPICSLYNGILEKEANTIEDDFIPQPIEIPADVIQSFPPSEKVLDLSTIGLENQVQNKNIIDLI